ncbi:MAG: YraN family protein [Clostridia bacterium]|nr:YraN family protein [Clostridia bacterium]
MTKNGLGNLGEDYACDVLEALDYEVLARNFRSRFGEVDIIARKDRFLCFVEVKTRSQGALGRPAAAVTASKQRKILLTAEYYITCHQAEVQRGDLQPRFDCMEVFADEEGRPQAYEYIKNAFDANL